MYDQVGKISVTIPRVSHLMHGTVLLSHFASCFSYIICTFLHRIRNRLEAVPGAVVFEAGCQQCFTTSSEVNIASDRHENLSKKMSVFHDLGHAIRVDTTRYVNLHQSRTHPRVGDKEELHQMFRAHLCLPSPHMQEPGHLVRGYINSVAKPFIRKKMLSTCSSAVDFLDQIYATLMHVPLL